MAPRKSITPADAALDSRLTRNDYRVLMILGRHADGNGRCLVKQGAVADQLGLTRRSVNRIIARLADPEVGYLEVNERYAADGGQLACAYRLKSPDVQAELAIGTDQTPPETHESHEGGTPASLGTTTPRVVGPTTLGVLPITTLSERKEEQTHTPRREFDRPVRVTGPRHRDRPTMEDGQLEARLQVTVAGEGGSAGQGRPPKPKPSEVEAWAPSDVDRAWACARGLSEAEVDEQGRRCRDHWLANREHGPPANLGAGWRRWVDIYQDRAAAAAMTSGGKDDGQQNRNQRGARGKTEADRMADAFRDLRTGDPRRG